ncbi:hypothetical protein QUF07_10965 [Lentilactobacillus sp. TOM.63]|uniref:hypothetical protein n=1 Tax=Lentilactobacillus TaxID=2767893 RepID=UPI001C25E2E8|nr:MULTISPECIES: hypothetical protein [Lentilactobacillus]MBU9789253.1 hypothetical protein [Lentilactobacillus dabitei]MDM7517223.1 hypothetical protein [Lentilactobacillus sp. TOM.63]
MSFNHVFYKNPYFWGFTFMFVVAIIATLSTGTPSMFSWQWWLDMILGIAWIAVAVYIGWHPPKNPNEKL